MLRDEFFKVFYEGDDGAAPAEGAAPSGESNLFNQVEKAPEGDKPPSGEIDLGDEETGRPEWCPEKFWDTEAKSVRGETLMKSYAEMERDYDRSKQNLPEGVPKETSEYFTDNIVKDGKVILPEGLQNTFEVASDNPTLLALADACRVEGVGVAVFEKLLPKYYAAIDAEMGPPIDPAAEMARLGPNSKSIITANEKYLDSLQAQGVLTQEQRDMAWNVFGTVAETMQVLDAFRVAAGEKPIPIGDTKAMPKFTEDELFDRMGDPKYGTDKSFTQETDEAYVSFYGTDPSGRSPVTSVGMDGAMRKDREVVKEQFKTDRA